MVETALECFLIVLRSNPVGKVVRKTKRRESRPRRVHRSIVVSVTAIVDNPSLPWESDPTILPNTIYAVGWVDRVEPGTYSAHDWVLSPVFVLPTPISLDGVGVGRNNGGQISPRPEHAPALVLLNLSLQLHRSGMPACEHSSTTWFVTGPAKEL